MTSGERMVFAAEFVRARAAGLDRVHALRLACTAVHVMRTMLERDSLEEGDRRALADMRGNGADR